MPGGFSRWNVNKDLSFVPIRVERVVEVTFGQLESGRFRHGVQFVQVAPRPHAGELPLRAVGSSQPSELRRTARRIRLIVRQ